MGTSFSYEESINNCLFNNDLSKVKSLLKNKKLSHENINKLLNDACYSNCLDIVLLLLKYEDLFLESKILTHILKNNNYDIFLVLLENNIILADQNTFELSCLYNYNFISLVYLYNNKVQLSKKAFLNSCVSNNIKNISFFLNLSFDFEMEDDILFHYICNNCSKKIVDYFCKICIRYNYTYDEYENIIPKIKSKEEYYIENKLWEKLINLKNIKLIDYFEEKECAISLTKSNFITNCNHYYEISSILEWYLKKSVCPICTTKINLEKCLIDSNLL